MFNYLKSFLNEYEYSSECIDVLLDAYKTLEKEDNLNNLFNIVNTYKIDTELSFQEFNELVNSFSKITSVHIYSLFLLIFILMSKTLLERYQRLGYPKDVYKYSMFDIKYKAVECHLVKGVWGNFVPSWEYAFFQMRLYGFSALQFEPMEAHKDFEVNGRLIKKGTKLLSVHIPRREKHLDEEEVQRNFKEVASFLKKDDPIFYCHSWLLFPRNKEMLSFTSHLMNFINLFTLMETYEEPNYQEMWRLFDMEIDENNLDSLPTNTSFRRHYVSLMKNKEKTGGGVGIYIPQFKD